MAQGATNATGYHADARSSAPVLHQPSAPAPRPAISAVTTIVVAKFFITQGNQMLDAHQLLWTQIAAGICLLIFGGMLFNLIRMRAQMQAARSWDKVEGIITVSRV